LDGGKKIDELGHHLEAHLEPHLEAHLEAQTAQKKGRR
jgi:hypothetical protein